MQFRFLGPLLVTLSAAYVSVPALVHAAEPVTLAAAPAAAPRQAVVTAARNNSYTLGIGSDDGAQAGVVYGVTANNNTRIRLQITEVRRTESTARLLDKEEDFVLAVGDTLQLLGTAPLPDAPVVAPPATGTIVPPVLPNASATGSMDAIAVSSVPAAITAVDGGNVTINAGTNQGVQVGGNLPIVRDKNIIGIVKVQTATVDSSNGTVIWHDESMSAIATGDSIGSVTASGANTGLGVVEGQPNVPAAPVSYETGASNAVVPRTDFTYELLAALASAKLITRYPANVFHDDGTRIHRTAEDITFTRAQIADLIREALQSEKAKNPSGKVRAALSFLVRDYARELQQLGVPAATLALYAPRGGIQLGISGQQRISLVGGDTNNVILPFSERQGGLRTRSGYDTRSNVFGTIGSKIRFSGTIDSGTEPSRSRDEPSFTVRRALLSYDAGRLLRGLNIEFGRQEVWWGPGHFGTLLLGDTAGPLASIHTTFKRGSYTLEGLYAPLGRGPAGGNRSLYGHNFQIQLGKQTRAGFAETVLMPKTALNPALFAATFSPALLFAVERFTNEHDNFTKQGNAMVQGYVETSLARGSSVYGELLLDDIGVNNNNNTRNRIGTLLGAHFYTPGDPTRLGAYLEYANLQFRTYLDLGQGLDYDYYYRNSPLGYPVAPFGAGNGGAESLRLQTYWRPTKRLRLGGGVEFADLNSEQPVLSRQQTIRLNAAYDLTRNLTLITRAQHVSTTQPNFILLEPAVKQNLFQVELAHSF